MHHGMTKSIEILDQGVRTLSTGIDEIRSARETAVESTPVPLGQALNLTKRTQVLRMHRRGETTHSIAAALQLPLGEVVLLLKIERLLDSEQAVASPPLSRSASAG